MSLKNLMASIAPNINVNVESLPAKASYAASAATATIGGWNASEFFMAFGAIIALLTFLVNCYFGWRRTQREKRQEKREQEMHDIMKAKMIMREPDDNG